MINDLHIERFMDIVDEALTLKPLTIITGENSAGKSAAIQAILAVLKNVDGEGDFLLKHFNYDFKSAVCKYDLFEDYKVTIGTDEGNITLTVNAGGAHYEPEKPGLGLEKNVYYLSANRLGYDETERKADRYSCGVQGEYLFGSLYQNQDKPMVLGLVTEDGQNTLGSLVDYWLRKIIGMKFKVHTEEQNASIIVSYDAEEQKGLMPNQLGTAVSYLAKVLIMCLKAKAGDVLLIENPEAYLHPKAQVELGVFLTTIVNAGVQLVVETHSENLISKIQYQIYSRQLDADMLAIYYKKNAHEAFEQVVIGENGRYEVDFPEGFFDASLDDLMEIG